MSTNQQLIKQFLVDWLDWVDAGAEEPNFLFNRREGLCAALYKWASRQVIGDNGLIATLKHDFYIELGRQHTPFNRDRDVRTDMPFYSVEVNKGESHLNTMRLAWAREYSK